MNKFRFRDLKKSSVYITPNLPVIETKRYKIKINSLILAILAYSFIVTIIVITVLAFTPAKNIIFIIENEKIKEQAQKIEQLEKKVLSFNYDLEKISSKKKLLEMALTIAGNDSLDSTSAIYDSLRYEPNKNLPIDGNILAVFANFVNKFIFNENDKEGIYFLEPLKGFVSKEYDPAKGHLGIDFSIKPGTPVAASAGGQIIFAQYTTDFGNTIIIQHNNEYLTKYYHCSYLLKKEREFVSQGEIIALSGNTGIKSSGPHLHFEIWKDGSPVDPRIIVLDLKN